MQRFRTFREFWPYYLQEHARPWTRALHYVGTSLVVSLVTVTVISGYWWLAIGLPIAGYGFAWMAHALIEENRPATFRYPLWSLAADFAMWSLFLIGGMRKELERVGVRTDGTVDPDKRL